MDTAEQKEKFLSLYNFIINSDDKEKMHVLGNLTKTMMMRAIETSPQQAQEDINRLESVMWMNYVTDKEADTIISKMDPKPSWSKSSWLDKMEKLKQPHREEHCYNENALYVTMSMICSDSGETLRDYAGIQDDSEMFNLIYRLAINKLKDKDKVFNIRRYFNL